MKNIMIAGAVALVFASCGNNSSDTSTEVPSTDSTSSTIQSGSAKGNSNLDNPGAGSTMDAQGNSVADSTKTRMDTTKPKN